MSARQVERVETDNQPVFWCLPTVHSSALNPLLNPALIDLARLCNLHRGDCLGLSLTFRAPGDNRLGRASQHDNLVSFNDYLGVPLLHRSVPRLWLPGFSVVKSCIASAGPAPITHAACVEAGRHVIEEA